MSDNGNDYVVVPTPAPTPAPNPVPPPPAPPAPPAPLPAPPAPVPMPAPDPAQGLDAARVQQVISLMLKLATAVALATPTQVDDKILAFLSPVVTQDWFAQLLVEVSGLFANGQQPSQAKVMQAIADFAAKRTAKSK